MENKVVVPHTRLEGKEYSPLIIRRYSTPFLHWIAVISDDNLDKLDEIDRKFMDNVNAISIQDMRDVAGMLTEKVSQSFKKVEGVAVVFAADKMMVSSLYGDFMNHEQCRLELFSLLNLSTGV